MSNAGVLIVHLHAHLPWIRHPEHASFMEEDWLFEAISETYVPLLAGMERLRRENVKFRLSFTLSPSLCEMLADDLLRSRYRARLEKLLELGRKELLRTRSKPDVFAAADFHFRHFRDVANWYDEHAGDIVGAFRSLQDSEHIEILTCGATHGILPLMSSDSVRRAQLRVAVTNYEKHFGRKPRGIWLPECAYAEGIDKLLASEGIRYAYLDTHGLLFADPCPPDGIWSPIQSKSGVFFLGRDIESSKQVWSAREGYPGDANYREFYRDIGYDADEDYIHPYLHQSGGRHNLGFKYYRITGAVDLSKKEPYNPVNAMLTAETHAGNFHFNRAGQFRHLREKMGHTPVILAPYDAELFGHWWFEGPAFIDRFLRVCAAHSADFRTGTASDALELCESHMAEPAGSSWGDGGYYGVWVNANNQWMYPHLHEIETRMVELARQHNSEGHKPRILRQLARELLLAQSSDWAFIATTGTTVPYAVRRFRDHVANFLRLYDIYHSPAPDLSFLSQLESRNCIFPEIDPSVYAEETRP